MPLASVQVLPPPSENPLEYRPGCAVCDDWLPVHPVWLGRPLVDGAVRLAYGIGDRR